MLDRADGLPREFPDDICEQDIFSYLISRVVVTFTGAGAFQRDPSPLQVSPSLCHLKFF